MHLVEARAVIAQDLTEAQSLDDKHWRVDWSVYYGRLDVNPALSTYVNHADALRSSLGSALKLARSKWKQSDKIFQVEISYAYGHPLWGEPAAHRGEKPAAEWRPIWRFGLFGKRPHGYKHGFKSMTKEIRALLSDAGRAGMNEKEFNQLNQALREMGGKALSDSEKEAALNQDLPDISAEKEALRKEQEEFEKEQQARIEREKEERRAEEHKRRERAGPIGRKIRQVPGWLGNDFLSSLLYQLEDGRTLSTRQIVALNKNLMRHDIEPIDLGLSPDKIEAAAKSVAGWAMLAGAVEAKKALKRSDWTDKELRAAHKEFNGVLSGLAKDKKIKKLTGWVKMPSDDCVSFDNEVLDALREKTKLRIPAYGYDNIIANNERAYFISTYAMARIAAKKLRTGKKLNKKHTGAAADIIKAAERI